MKEYSNRANLQRLREVLFILLFLLQAFKEISVKAQVKITDFRD